MENNVYKNGEYVFTVSDEILFADRSKEKRSGHLGHALVEYEKGKVLAFYPNCSGEKWSGHNACGWAEYKRSLDGGKTWGEAEFYPFSKTLYDLGISVYSSCEKAVLAKNGDIIAFNFICDLIDNDDCGYEPFRIPSYCVSHDKGKTWSAPVKIGAKRGRIYDARVFDGDIYVLLHYAVNSVDRTLPTEYHLFKSTDDGKTFSDISTLPFAPDPSYCRYYGTMAVIDGGKMIAYSYMDDGKTDRFDYSISADGGVTWSTPAEAYFAKQMRNPQLIKFKNSYFMFGRSGSHGGERMGHNIMYFSKDGINWDEGRYLKMRTCGAGAYSNVIVVHDGERERLLLQMSYAYEQHRTNVYHWFIDAEKI
ncbi:MAG: exo-alpha-sialidase [Clostridia bacterium]|nr:exo-alpha-sialidase [Clostridia bacterium]